MSTNDHLSEGTCSKQSLSEGTCSKQSLSKGTCSKQSLSKDTCSKQSPSKGTCSEHSLSEGTCSKQSSLNNTENSSIMSSLLRLRHVIRMITESTIFSAIVMVTIVSNAIVLAVETDDGLRSSWGSVFDILDEIYLAIYTVEFILKNVAKPKVYWTNGYDIFDGVLIFISYIQIIVQFTTNVDPSKIDVLRILRALRTLRMLRTISYSKGLQVLVIALIDTLCTWVIHILILLLVVMFLFAVMGYYFFGYDEDGDVAHWGTLGKSMLTLFTLVTADGWTEIQAILDDKGYNNSAIFIITFVILGNFIFTNIFVGVIIMNISDATETFVRLQEEKKKEAANKKYQFILEKQQNDVKKLYLKQKQGNFAYFSDFVSEYQKRLHHEDSIMMTDISTNLLWMETFIRTLDHMDADIYRIQQLHFEIGNHLADVLEDRLVKKQP